MRRISPAIPAAKPRAATRVARQRAAASVPRDGRLATVAGPAAAALPPAAENLLLLAALALATLVLASGGFLGLVVRLRRVAAWP